MRQAVLIEDIYYIDNDMEGVYSASDLKLNKISEKGELLEWDEDEKQWYLDGIGFFSPECKFIKEV